MCRKAILRVCAVVVLAWGAGSVPVRAALGELLENGGFEAGQTAWSGFGLSISICPPRSGSAAMGITHGEAVGVLRQRIETVIAAGRYTLRGWARSQQGAPRLEVNLIWADASGTELQRTKTTLAPGASYASFSLAEDASPAAATRLDVRILNTAAGTTACLDDLSLDGPPPATASPTPTASPMPTASPTPTPTTAAAALASPSPSATGSAGFATPAAAQASGQASPVASAAGFTLVNGGFEAGLLGWQKFGGDLRLTSSPVHGGANAGALFSETASTKWAYQTVVIDPAKRYEFYGFVQAGAGVARAFLRISWYASADGSGSALSTSDSTSIIEGASAEFTYLTTGPVAPPAGARSARPRVMLAPVGAGPAVIFLDDLGFEEAAPATPTTTPVVPAAADADSTDALPRARSAGEAAPATASPVLAGEVPSARTTAGPEEESQRLPLPPTAKERDEGVPVLWLAGAALLVIGLGGAYFRSRGEGPPDD